MKMNDLLCNGPSLVKFRTDLCFLGKFRSMVFFTVFTAIISGYSCQDQTNRSGTFSIENDGLWKKASTAHRLSQFPMIHPDGRLWFRFAAPETADSVKLQIDGFDYVMQKDTSGLWNVIIPGTGPGFQIYNFVVDGVNMMDPGCTPSYVNGYTSVIEYPAPKDEFYLIKDVPHGEVREHWFYSDVTKSYRRRYVYTPPDYETNTSTHYPVLYLQHGGGELENEWTHAGKANFILDNLIAEKTACPMIIVMNLGFATYPEQAGQILSGNSRWAAFEEMLIDEVIPDVDAFYRTIPDRQNRAMAGLSMGGMQTFNIGLKRLETFSHIGFFSGVPTNYEELLKDVMKQWPDFKERLTLLWSGAGVDEKQFVDRQNGFQKMIEEAGIEAKFYLSDGTAHEWQTWRRCLHEFAPLLFKQNK